jgi:hypothetical protein
MSENKFLTEIDELAWAIGVCTETLRSHAALGDKAGVRYSIKKLIAYTKATAGVFRDMIEAEVRQHERAMDGHSRTVERAAPLERASRV